MMDADTARERFSDAVEGLLDPDERAQWQAALDRDPELRAEYEAFEATVHEIRALGGARPSVDLVKGVQDKLRARSRGRYYRDRFSRRTPGQTVILLVAAGLLLAVVVATWLLYGGLLP